MTGRSLVGILCLLAAGTALAQPQPFEKLVGKVDVAEVAATGPRQVPFILWGGDVATFVANGGLTTKPDSIYAKAGLNLKLVPGDDFPAQVKDYLGGKSPYLRGTVEMIAAASELLSKNEKTKPVMFLQLTWSAGDHMVARERVKTLNGLKGKKICLQSPGPHLALLYDSLQAVRLSLEDVTVVWAKDLTGTPQSPAEMFRKDPSLDACCVVTPDMTALCGGLKSVGTGDGTTVKGARVVNSTASMGHSIADVYCVRSDFFTAHRAEVEKFLIGYLKATEELLAAKKAYNDGKGKSPAYVAALKLAQTIYGNKTLPSIEEDAHGLVCDANFVRIPGNEAFFNDPNNLVGFKAKQNSALDLVVKLGYAGRKTGFEKADWDYRKISQAVGVKYTSSEPAKGRFKVETTDFPGDLESDTLFTFEIRFEPEQTTFPVERYAADFQRFAKASATFSNAAIVIEGHSDPTLALQQFFRAAKAKGLITGTAGNYQFKGKPLRLTDTKSVLEAIQNESLAGQQWQDSRGGVVEIPDPRQTVVAALNLSQRRAEAVKAAIEQYAKDNNLKLDLSQAIPRGVGIANPVKPRPANPAEAKENMRVVFRAVRVAVEAVKEDDFNFEK